MQLAIRRSNERGHADHGWLDSRHTFSFAEYYDPRFMGFGHLRVINEDRVAPGGGFPTHGHRNMEIISYVVSGGLGHRDTLGNGEVLRPGEVQVMSAGRGISHSEMNASRTEPVHFLQIWVLPKEGNTQPRYEQRKFEGDGLVLLASPDARDGSLGIGQDTDLYRLTLAAQGQRELTLRRGHAWVQVVAGDLEVEGALLHPGDGAALADASRLRFTAHGPVEALVFDLL